MIIGLGVERLRGDPEHARCEEAVQVAEDAFRLHEGTASRSARPHAQLSSLHDPEVLSVEGFDKGVNLLAVGDSFVVELGRHESASPEQCAVDTVGMRNGVVPLVT